MLYDDDDDDDDEISKKYATIVMLSFLYGTHIKSIL